MASKRTSAAASPAGAGDLSNIEACVHDVARALKDPDRGPRDLTRFAPLRSALARAGKRLPPAYREALGDPLLAKLDKLGPAGFKAVLAADPDRLDSASLLLDAAQVVHQAGDGAATDAFQEVVSDLYDGFLSAEDRRGVKLPERSVLAPMVKWGCPADGPYTWPPAATASLGAKTGLVNLPPGNARNGLCVWAALGHETAGHDILGADHGLKAELAEVVRRALREAGMTALAGYWAERIEESASDVLGILNMGPAAGFGLLATLRGFRLATGSGGRLQSEGAGDDEHPADVVRGFLAAATIRTLPFGGATAWAAAVERETNLDVQVIRLSRREVSLAEARGSAATTARAIAATPLRTLEGHALGEIQTWRDRDDRIVARLAAALVGGGKVDDAIERGDYAAHAVAAAVTTAIGREGDPAALQPRLVKLLAAMHRRNPGWGPLKVAHASDLSRRRFFPAVR
jgi:hypothetical protein